MAARPAVAASPLAQPPLVVASHRHSHWHERMFAHRQIPVRVVPEGWPVPPQSGPPHCRPSLAAVMDIRRQGKANGGINRMTCGWCHSIVAGEKRHGDDAMTVKTTSSEAIRRYATRVLAAGAMLAIYSVATLGVTGVVLTGASTAAQAQWRGRGWRGRGWRGWRGWRGRGRLVCRHRAYSSRRVCWRV